MHGPDPRPDNTPWLVPYLTVADAGASQEFCCRAFGFETGRRLTGRDGQVVHAEVRFDGLLLAMFGPETPAAGLRTPAHSGVGCPLSLYVYCDDVDALVTRAAQAGAELLSGPEDAIWGDRVARLRDPDGYEWTFATNVHPFDPTRVALF